MHNTSIRFARSIFSGRSLLIGVALGTTQLGCPGGSSTVPAPAPNTTVTYNPTAQGANGTFKFDIICSREGNVAVASAILAWENKPTVMACPEVTYIQVVRTTDSHGHEGAQSGQQGRMTPDGWSVDKLNTHQGGGVWYPVKNDGSYDPGLGAPGQTPGGNLPRLDDNIQSGGSHWPITYEYITCAVCKSGANLGRVLDCVYWTFTFQGDGSATSPQASVPTDAQKATFKDAVNRWNTQAAGSGGAQPAAPTLIW